MTTLTTINDNTKQSNPNNNNQSVNKVSNYSNNNTDIIGERVNKLLTVNKALSLIHIIERKKKENVNKEQLDYLNYLKKLSKEKYGIDLDNKFDREFAEALYYETVVVGFRIPLIYKYKLNSIKKNPIKWKMFKATFLELIDAFVQHEIDLQMQKQSQNININLNPVVIYNNIEAKAEAAVENKINVSFKEIVRLVERLYNLSHDNPHMPPLQRDLIKQLYKKITAVVN